MRAAVSRRGFSLVEMLISVSLLGLVFAAAGLVSRTSHNVYSQSSQASAVEVRARRAVDRVVDELSTLVRTLMVPDLTAVAWSETLDFQQATGVVASAVSWGPPLQVTLEYEPGEVNDGMDNDGDGLVDEGQLVLVRNVALPGELRTVLARGVSELAERETANGADDNGNGLVDERGFSLEREGDVIRVRLTLESMGADERRIVRSVATSFRLRN